MIGDKYKFERKLGDDVRIPDPSANFKATVAGIDRYTEQTLAGRVNSWVSYTVTSDAPKDSQWHRFYLVDGQADVETGQAHARRSFYVLDQETHVPDGFQIDQNLSGYVELKSEGDAALSGGDVSRGALTTFRNEGGEIWAREVFKPDAGSKLQPLSFKAIFEEPGQEI